MLIDDGLLVVDGLGGDVDLRAGGARREGGPGGEGETDDQGQRGAA
ncbi:MAG: hypothetical protein R3A52_29010 [Polyangiales bacterium]